MVAPLLHLSPPTTMSRLGVARMLTNDLPRTLAAGLAGDLEPWRVGALVSAAAGVAPDKLNEFEAQIFDGRGVGDSPAGALRRRADRIAARVDPASVAERVDEGRRRCSVDVVPGDWPGTTSWTAIAPTARSTQAWGAICELAEEYLRARPGTDRGQARSEAFLDLLLGETQGVDRRDRVNGGHRCRLYDRRARGDHGRGARRCRHIWLPAERRRRGTSGGPGHSCSARSHDRRHGLPRQPVVPAGRGACSTGPRTGRHLSIPRLRDARRALRHRSRDSVPARSHRCPQPALPVPPTSRVQTSRRLGGRSGLGRHADLDRAHGPSTRHLSGRPERVGRVPVRRPGAHRPGAHHGVHGPGAHRPGAPRRRQRSPFVGG
ncbi:MAG: hypothetical protein IPL45_03770 [Actinomycetales bacterium]|nr:hypothetical protein [Actinomycetales bacterium]